MKQELHMIHIKSHDHNACGHLTRFCLSKHHGYIEHGYIEQSMLFGWGNSRPPLPGLLVKPQRATVCSIPFCGVFIYRHWYHKYRPFNLRRENLRREILNLMNEQAVLARI